MYQAKYIGSIMHDFTGDHHGLRWHDLDQADSWNNINIALVHAITLSVTGSIGIHTASTAWFHIHLVSTKNKCPPQASWLAENDADKEFAMQVFHAFKCVISVWMFRDTESKIGTVVPWAHYGLLVVYIYIWFPIFIINMHNTINIALHVFFNTSIYVYVIQFI